MPGVREGRSGSVTSTETIVLEHRAGIEPANTGFADQRVSHFATGAHLVVLRAASLTRAALRVYLFCLGGKILFCQVPGFYCQPGSAAVGALARVFHRDRGGHNDRISPLPVGGN
jgi:hypothetical protein